MQGERDRPRAELEEALQDRDAFTRERSEMAGDLDAERDLWLAVIRECDERAEELAADRILKLNAEAAA